MKKTLIAILALSLVVFFAPVSARAETTDAPTGDVTAVTDLPTGDTTTVPTPSDDDSAPSGDTTTVSGPSDDDLPPPGDTTTVSGPSTPTTPTAPTTPTHAPTDPNVGQTGGGGGGFTPFIVTGGPSSSAGTVLGASTDDAASCSISFVNYMKRGQRGADVRELQVFLNKELGLKIPLTGYFGSQTEAAVRAFQLKYASEILAPWANVGKLPNQNTSTGYVYKTTLRKINLIRCAALNIPQIAPADLN